MGYTPRPLRLWTDRYDLIVTSGHTPLFVEVKAAHETRRKVRPGYYAPRWQFNTRDRPRLDHVVILVCQDAHGVLYPFVCPSWLFFGRDNVSITSHPRQYVKRGRGMFAEYFERWDTIGEVMTRRAHTLQLPLLKMLGCEAGAPQGVVESP